jgi:hypothetical protein
MNSTEMGLPHLTQPICIREVEGAALNDIHGIRVKCLAQRAYFSPSWLRDSNQ